MNNKWKDCESVHGADDGYSDETRPDWTSECENCGQTPIVPMTGLCGPCTFGEANTTEGN